MRASQRGLARASQRHLIKPIYSLLGIPRRRVEERAQGDQDGRGSGSGGGKVGVGRSVGVGEVGLGSRKGKMERLVDKRLSL